MSNNIQNKSKDILRFAMVLCFGVALVLFMYFQIKQLIYQERKALLNQLVETSASTFDENINSQWHLIDFFKNTIKAELNENKEVSSFLKQFQNKDDDYYFLVDKKGKYYCSDGNYGKIVDTEYFNLDNNEEDLEYLGSLPHLDSSTTYLVFRKQLEEPITCLYNGTKVEIAFCGSIHNIDSLAKRVSNLFAGNNNLIVFSNTTGIMLYKQLNLGLLIDGYNIYEKYKNASIMYNEESNNIIDNIKKDNNTVSLLKIQNDKFYICTSSLSVSDWTLLMVVDNTYFDMENSSNIMSILTTVGVVAILMSILVISTVVFRLKNKNNLERLEQEKKLSLALESAYKTKSDFLSYMSHDIRTPINGIIGMSNIGRNIKGNSDKTNDCFNKIDTASKHLLSLVNDVLDMSALESGKVIIKNESFNLRNLLNNCLDIINGQLSNRELEIVSDIYLPIENLIGDELHLKQVLINILGNALKFTNDGGRISLTCKQIRQESNSITYSIAIQDTGIGISKELQEHLFDAFVQGNNNRSQYKGTGLGMAISYRYVQMMNGTLSVESEEGVGSTFIVEIPFEIDTNNKNEDISNLRILLVEDNELNIEIAKELLKEKGAIVEVAHNGKEAVDLISHKENEYDLILMDVMMPIMNGLEASQKIREINAQIPIIALSANTFKDDVDAFQKAGMNAYASKPLNIESLVKTINEVRK